MVRSFFRTCRLTDGCCLASKLNVLIKSNERYKFESREFATNDVNIRYSLHVAVLRKLDTWENKLLDLRNTAESSRRAIFPNLIILLLLEHSFLACFFLLTSRRGAERGMRSFLSWKSSSYTHTHTRTCHTLSFTSPSRKIVYPRILYLPRRRECCSRVSSIIIRRD